MEEYMKKALEEANSGVEKNEGGPFGAIIVDKSGKVIAKSHNKVLINKDPTAHAEIEVIRLACKNLDTYDLKDYILYTSCEPCPMCISAIIWANIKEVYYLYTKEDAKKIGFKDDMIYDYIKGRIKNKDEILKLTKLSKKDNIDIFEEYKKNKKIIY